MEYTYPNLFLRAVFWHLLEQKLLESKYNSMLQSVEISHFVEPSLLSLSCMTSMLGADDIHDDLWVE